MNLFNGRCTRKWIDHLKADKVKTIGYGLDQWNKPKDIILITEEIMSDFEEYLEFIRRFNPSHTFSDEELEFLRNDFQDLKTFVEELGKTKTKRTAVNFEEVLKDEIFYHQGNSYVKIDKTQAREFPGTRIQVFGKLTEVEIN